MSGPTLNLPSDPAAIEQAAAVIAEHATDDEQARKLAAKWATKVAPNHAERVAAAVVAELGPNGSGPQARGDDDARARFRAEMRASIDQAPAADDKPGLVAKWEPGKAALVGEVFSVEALSLKNKNGTVRCFTVESDDDELTELWVLWAQLFKVLRRMERRHGQPIREGDWMAVRRVGSIKTGRYESHTFAVDIRWAD